MQNFFKSLMALSLCVLTLNSASAFWADMGTYHQNYDVTSDTSILILESDTNYKIKFKGISPNVDQTTLAHKDLPKGVVEIKHDEHKTMGTSTIHVVEVEDHDKPFTGFIHLVTYNGDGGDREKHKDHFARTLIKKKGTCKSKRERVCGVVSFSNTEKYKIEFRNKCEMERAGATLANEGRCMQEDKG